MYLVLALRLEITLKKIIKDTRKGQTPVKLKNYFEKEVINTG
jgi:hypothetical protein